MDYQTNDQTIEAIRTEFHRVATNEYIDRGQASELRE